jgi:hypothetical protein
MEVSMKYIYMVLIGSLGTIVGFNLATLPRNGHFLVASSYMETVGKLPDSRPLWAQQYDTNSYIGEETPKRNNKIPVTLMFVPTNAAATYILQEVRYDNRPVHRENDTHKRPAPGSSMRLCSRALGY